MRKSVRRIVRGRDGFSLFEVMICVMILGIMVSLAVPQMLLTRENSRQKNCVGNLRMIDNAKLLYTLDNQAPDGTVIPLSTLIGTYIKGNEFVCPSSQMGYEATMKPLGETPVCPTPWVGFFPHRLSYE